MISSDANVTVSGRLLSRNNLSNFVSIFSNSIYRVSVGIFSFSKSPHRQNTESVSPIITRDSLSIKPNISSIPAFTIYKQYLAWFVTNEAKCLI